jgi:hypothetical protein
MGRGTSKVVEQLEKHRSHISDQVIVKKWIHHTYYNIFATALYYNSTQRIYKKKKNIFPHSIRIA